MQMFFTTGIQMNPVVMMDDHFAKRIAYALTKGEALKGVSPFYFLKYSPIFHFDDMICCLCKFHIMRHD